MNYVVNRDFEYVLGAYEAIDKDVPIRDSRWVAIHVNQASDAQMIAPASTNSVTKASPSGACWMAACRGRDS